ncbi:MAG: peptide chain release factor N(5)-glutamine methyltransferase [Candidatus Omnitrophica bacterium]|nr:peptide chain release factor N(5)-glutamine methyltransferase [Candidatus Omnitrophota bacterium]
MKISNTDIEHNAHTAGTQTGARKRIKINEIIRRLKDAGIESPAANAQAILRSLLNSSLVDLYVNEAELCADDFLSLEQMLNRRIKGEPLQYILGMANFLGHDIKVKKGVFIPRPETEILVQTMTHFLSGPRQLYPLNILDLCTGSGNIAISLTKALTHCKIISSDISDEALETAKKNAALNNVSESVISIKADLFSLPDDYRKLFDAVICNPPYISCADMNGIPVELRHEPGQALCGGADGMDFYRRIIKDSPDFLKKDGIIGLEIPDNSSNRIKAIVDSSGMFYDINFFDDLNGIARVVTARLK